MSWGYFDIGSQRPTSMPFSSILMISPFAAIPGMPRVTKKEPIFEATAAARHSIDVVSAYLSHPFTDHLAAARRRGVEVRVLTPGQNNKPNFARHILQTAHRHGFDVFRCAGMSHLKAMLIDGDLLIAGSSNFEFMSYHILEELVVMTKNRDMIDAFVERVWAPDLRSSRRANIRPSLGTRLGHAAILVGAAVAARFARPGSLPSKCDSTLQRI